jgi:hypothetical protein
MSNATPSQSASGSGKKRKALSCLWDNAINVDRQRAIVTVKLVVLVHRQEWYVIRVQTQTQCSRSPRGCMAQLFIVQFM